MIRRAPERRIASRKLRTLSNGRVVVVSVEREFTPAGSWVEATLAVIEEMEAEPLEKHVRPVARMLGISDQAMAYRLRALKKRGLV